MKLTNGKETVDINNPGAIKGFLNAGWREVAEETKPAPSKKTAKAKQ